MTPETVEASLASWGLAGDRATLINLSENHTFRLDGPDGARHVLRVHRPGYQSRAAIESELDWIAALRRDTPLRVPRPVQGVNGAYIQPIAGAGPETGWTAVLFEFEPGSEPSEEGNLRPLFERLGGIAALCHLHVAKWVRPGDFMRPTWDASTILEPNDLWGDWRSAPNLDGEGREVLDRLDSALRTRLWDYGRDEASFGLIHADMRLANLLADGERLTLIDFDDCGFGWFGYDFGAAMSFMEARADLAELKAEWLQGYREHRPFRKQDERMLDTFVMLRRMALLAWVGSHAETDLAASHAGTFAPVTIELAERYLRDGVLAT